MFRYSALLAFIGLTLCHFSSGQECFGENCDDRYFLEDTEQCVGMECESKEALLEMISKMQKEKHDEYTAPLKNPARINTMTSEKIKLGELVQRDDANPTCSICNNPLLCINGGVCVAHTDNPWKNYHCICPDNTSGQNCQNIIQCKANTCGQNADCYVSNRQLNCVCKPGYSPSSWGSRNCDLKTIKSCMNGDPHYVTFDNLRYDYQGTCPYVFSEPCGNLTAPYVHYSVRAKNELPGSGYHISQVSEVEVDFYDITVHVDGRSKIVFVNGLKVLTPWYYPNSKNWKVRVRYNGYNYIIDNDQKITVTFSSLSSLCVEVPNVPAFNGNRTLCGLAGNIDGHWKNDVVDRSGDVLPITSSRQPSNKNHADFYKHEDSWITDNFLKLRPGQEICINGQTIDNNTNCDVGKIAAYCYPIQQAELGVGPFANCQGLGNDTLEDFYYNCIYDVCANGNYKCNSLWYFLQTCQNLLPYTQPDPSWRAQTNCPLACPTNSHHSTCVSSCLSTCAEPFPEYCDASCTDSCECDPGYVADNTYAGTLRCIRLDQCGCTDEYGNAHRASSPWFTNNCTIYHECRNGSLFSDYRPCSDLATCVSSLSNVQCKCNSGYRGDGYNCTDIDECIETPGICGHGMCVNLPGTYQCQCDTFWTGNSCNQYKPRRHCADLYVYWGERDNKVYSVNPPYLLPGRKMFDPYQVYCDMHTNGGGYTLMSSDEMQTNLNFNKTYQDYIRGFGAPENKSVWLGLEFIHQMTDLQPHTLRLNLYRCASNGRPEKYTDCTYGSFGVLDATTQYTVVIPKGCTGSEADDHYYQDGWARWNLTMPGPKFSTWDLEEEYTPAPPQKTIQGVEEDAVYYSCSKTNFNTGWWYVEDQLCGAANLNGIRYTCPTIPVDDEKYLRWSQGTLGQSWMYLRPAGYPKYDPLG